MSAIVYLLAGFSVAWVVVFAYLWLLSRRAAELQRKLQSLEKRCRED